MKRGGLGIQSFLFLQNVMKIDFWLQNVIWFESHL